MALIEVVEVIRRRPKLEALGGTHRAGLRYVYDDASLKILSQEVFNIGMGDSEFTCRFNRAGLADLGKRGDGISTRDLSSENVTMRETTNRRGDKIFAPDFDLSFSMSGHDAKIARGGR